MHTGEYRHEGSKTITYMPEVLFLMYVASLLKIPPQKESNNADSAGDEVFKVPLKKLQQEPLDLLMHDGSMSVIYVFNKVY